MGDFVIWDVLICALWCVGILGLVWVLAGWFLLPLSGKTADGDFSGVKARGFGAAAADTLSGCGRRGYRGARFLSSATGWTQRKTLEAEAFARDRIYLHRWYAGAAYAIVKMGWNDDEAGRTDDSRTVQSVLFQNPENGYSF